MCEINFKEHSVQNYVVERISVNVIEIMKEAECKLKETFFSKKTIVSVFPRGPSQLTNINCSFAVFKTPIVLLFSIIRCAFLCYRD